MVTTNSTCDTIHYTLYFVLRSSRPITPRTFLRPPPCRAANGYISNTLHFTASTRARHVPDGTPNCSPRIMRGWGGPQIMGGRAVAAHCDYSSQKPRPFTRPKSQKTRPLPPEQKRLPASTSSPRQSFWSPRQTGGTTGEREDNYNRCLFIHHGNCI